MITEDYISFETAKLLKEKGFNERTNKPHIDDYQRLVCYIPTLQMAMKWLRTKYKLHIEPCTTIDNGVFTGKWHCYVHFLVDRTYPLDSDHVGENYTSYEEACEAGIKYCLENLI